MAQVYKALKEFEFDGRTVKIGEEIVCRAREGEELLKKKLVQTQDRELDPKDDAHLIKQMEERGERRRSGIRDTDADREAKKEERESETDARRAEKIGKAKSLVEDDGENHAAFDRMTEEELDATIEKLESAAAGEPEKVDDSEDGEDEADEEAAPEEKPTPGRRGFFGRRS